ncbi:DUF1028 domain-containing protein [Dyella tabacisoli]|nr:DUF1028 domain-containing protein [Dyella tabacisoli]
MPSITLGTAISTPPAWRHWISLSIGMLCGIALSNVQATYSIAACDMSTKTCGVAVQTNNLAVGASVPYAQAGVGAVASQFETNPVYGPKGLALMKAGKTPKQALQQLLAEDGNFEGEGIQARQVALVGIDGLTAVYTGAEAQQANWAGSRCGPGYSIQGNGLAGPQVIEQMEQTYLHAAGSLAERLLAALSAGDAAGGQRSGRESSALLVKTPQGWPVDIDLRVDHATDPVGELRHLLNLEMARRQTVTAQRLVDAGQFDQAREQLDAALAKAPDWPRLWLRAARIAMQMDEPGLAMRDLDTALVRQPAWAATELNQGVYAELGQLEHFHAWIDTAQKQQTLRDADALTTHATVAERVALTRRLLEDGDAATARKLIDAIPVSTGSAAMHEVRADIALAQTDTAKAAAEIQLAVAAAPDDLRLRKKALRLKQALPKP